MGGRLAGQVAWVSGGGSGIGEGIAKLFAEEGAKVAVVEVRAEPGERVVKEITEGGGEAFFAQADVSKEADVKASIDATVQHYGGLNSVVNVAGIVQVGPLHEVKESDWDLLMEVNVKSIYLSTKHAYQHLRKNQPSYSYIVNMGSISSFVGQAMTPGYTTSKGAVLQLSRSIALDYAADKIRCNCICPGITDTPLFRHHVNSTPDPAATLANRLRRVPLGIPLTPRDIAKAALYFSCEDSSGITGQSLIVDAGYLAAAEWDTGIG